MRNIRLFLIIVLICLGVGLVAAQDDPDIIPMPPAPTTELDDDLIPMPPAPTTELDDDLVPMPPAPTTELDDDLIPMPPTSTLEPGDCITSQVGQTYCYYPTIVPTQAPNLPTLAPDASRITPGYWRKTRASVIITGTCTATGVGHNPGGGGGSAPTPVIPTVPIFQSNAGDFLFIDGYAYAKLQPQTYGDSNTSRQLGMTLTGATTAVNITSSIEYQIVSPSLIVIHDTYTEEGGCTIATDSKYELVKTDSTVVTTVDDIVYPQPTTTPISAEGTPVAPVPPIPPGTYPVTWTIDSGTCTDKTQPTFTEAKVDYANNGDMLLRLGDDTHTLFALGDQTYTRYQLVSSERQITVQVLSGVIKMDWGRFAGMSMCFKGGELSTTSAPAATPLPSINPTTTPVAAAGGKQFQISFKPDESMCPKTIQSKLPNFDGAAFEALPDGSYQLTVSGETLTFKDQYGYATYDGSVPSKGITYQISAQLHGQNGLLGLTYMTATGEMCLAQMSLSLK